MAIEKRQRTALYCGPLIECARRELPGIELRGGYVAERKYDGAWCAWFVDQAGPRSHRFESRVGLEFEGMQVNGLSSLDMGGLGRGTIIVGELETASEEATKNYRRLGYRRFFAFDLISYQGVNLRNAKYRDRQALLRNSVRHSIPRSTLASGRIVFVEQSFEGFKSFYDTVVKEGGEGIIVKPLDSSAIPKRSDGKTPEWIRCKPWTTIDYVISGYAYTEKKQLAAKLGLWRNGSVRTVMQCGIDDLELINGKLAQEGMVVELYGRELMASGALRHGTFRRFRTDKRPDECTGERKLWSEKPEV